MSYWSAQYWNAHYWAAFFFGGGGVTSNAAGLHITNRSRSVYRIAKL